MEYTTELLSYVLLVVAALIPIANPFSTAPLFVGMTTGLSKAQRNSVATRATVYMFIILVVFLLLGAVLLSFFGISLSALRIAGGLIIGFIGFKMLFFEDEKTTEEEITMEDANKIAFTPLAMPMLSGPGSIAVVMTMAVTISELASVSDQMIGYGVVTIGIAVSAFISWLVLRASRSVIQFMGTSGIDALTKIMGFLLMSIGVQFLIGGVQSIV